MLAGMSGTPLARGPSGCCACMTAKSLPQETHALHAAISTQDQVTVCRSSLPFAREFRLGVWFGFVAAALLAAVGTCVVLAFGAIPGR